MLARSRTLSDVVTEGQSLYRLAWITAKRLELIDRTVDFDAYADTYALEVDQQETAMEDPDPTRPAAPPGG